jgi:hypothetical protein
MRDVATIQGEINQAKLAHSDAVRTTATLTAKRDQAIQRAKQADQEAQDYERGRIVSDNQEGLALRRLAELEKELAEAEAAKEAAPSK